jgi:hypothetical protein
MNKKLLAFVAAMSLIFGSARSANGLISTLDTYSVDLNDSDPGLSMYCTPILETTFSHDFTVGEEVTIDLFTIGTTESLAGNNDDKVPYPITVTFDFSSPLAIVDATGQSRGHSFLFSDWGTVKREGPTVFNFGDTKQFVISLWDASFWA